MCPLQQRVSSRKIMLKLWILLQTVNLLPCTAKYRKSKSEPYIHYLQGKHGKHRPSKPRKQTEFNLLQKYWNSIGLGFSLLHRTPALPASHTMQLSARWPLQEGSLHQMKLKALFSNIIHSLFPGKSQQNKQTNKNQQGKHSDTTQLVLVKRVWRNFYARKCICDT